MLRLCKCRWDKYCKLHKMVTKVDCVHKMSRDNELNCCLLVSEMGIHVFI